MPVGIDDTRRFRAKNMKLLLSAAEGFVGSQRANRYNKRDIAAIERVASTMENPSS